LMEKMQLIFTAKCTAVAHAICRRSKGRSATGYATQLWHDSATNYVLLLAHTVKGTKAAE